VAALFALFGQSRLTLGLAPVLLDAIAALLLWRIGRRLFDRRIAVLAVLIFWVWPEVFLYQSTFEYGFRLMTLVCGLAGLLFALRLTESPSTRLRDWSAFGFFLGVGWRCSPEIVYHAAPALIWVVYRAIRRRVRPRLAGVTLSVAMVALGARSRRPTSRLPAAARPRARTVREAADPRRSGAGNGSPRRLAG
jgi:4-amino-4-deoxy-L-arabinose transferase-like glycosyltransferase